MIKRLQKAIENYAKRQMTWFKRDKRIVWLKDKKTAEQLAEKFLKN
jgi:tRNA dimethylallyltransferase